MIGKAPYVARCCKAEKTALYTDKAISFIVTENASKYKVFDVFWPEKVPESVKMCSNVIN